MGLYRVIILSDIHRLSLPVGVKRGTFLRSPTRAAEWWGEVTHYSCQIK